MSIVVPSVVSKIKILVKFNIRQIAQFGTRSASFYLKNEN